jgi:hypothetical protein
VPATYTGDADPRKIRDAGFLAAQTAAVLKSLTSPDVGTDLRDMAATAADIAATVQRTQRCTDKQMRALENILKGVRKWAHGNDA